MSSQNVSAIQRHLPLTRACSLIEADDIKAIERICREYFTREIERDLKLLGLTTGIRITSRSVNTSLTEALSLLDPLTKPPTRHLLIPADGGWTAYFDNQVGMESNLDIADEVSRELKVRAITVVRQPETIETKSRQTSGFFGVVRFVIHKGGKIVRSVDCYQGEEGWEFGQEGKPLKFEAVNQYKAKKKKDRFTVETLDSYLEHLGVRPLDDSFYLIGKSRPGALIQRVIDHKELASRVVYRPLKEIREMTWREEQ